jgi:hypothetical protein
MKQKQLDNVHTLVCQLCATLRDDTVSLTRLSDLLDCVIELARTGHTIEAIAINREVMSFLAEGHSRSVHDARQKAWADSMAARPSAPVGSGTANPVWWKAAEVDIRTTQPSVTGYVQLRPDAPKPAATVEQMRAAADKAMMTEDNTYLCAGCGQKTLTDGEKPLGWHFNANVHGGVYRALCGTCFAQGPFDEWECDSCGKTSFPMRSLPTGWMEQQVRRGDDDIVMETVCDECAMGGES